MAKVFNANTTPQELKKSPIPEYSWGATQDIAKLSGLSDFACNIRTLAKGQISYPYHFHHGADEMFVILSGNGQLRTPEGVQTVGQGDIIFFETGEGGAHQLKNDLDEPLTYLDLRAVKDLDVCEYPDTGKVNILPQKDIFKRGVSASYFEGEEPKKD